MEQHPQQDYYLTTETFIPRDEKVALGIPELICKLSSLRTPVLQRFPQRTQNAYGDNTNKCISNAFLSIFRMYMGLIIINVFLMHWIPLWLYMCVVQSAAYETWMTGSNLNKGSKFWIKRVNCVCVRVMWRERAGVGVGALSSLCSHVLCSSSPGKLFRTHAPCNLAQGLYACTCTCFINNITTIAKTKSFSLVCASFKQTFPYFTVFCSYTNVRSSSNTWQRCVHMHEGSVPDNWFKEFVSNWILTSCQLPWVTS